MSWLLFSIFHELRKILPPPSVDDQHMLGTIERVLEAELWTIDYELARAEEIQLTVGGDYAKEFLIRAIGAAYSVEDSLGSLEALARSKADLGPATGIRTRTQTLQLQRQASGVSGPNRKEFFYGREEDEKSILESLSKTQENGGKVKVISIRGEAGVGKTALAGLIYFNAGVIRSFELRVWVTLPQGQGASVCDVVEKILETVTEDHHRFSSQSNDLQLLLSKLEMYLAGRKFLLVLDNCCIKDNSENWDKMIGSLGFTGSAIIILTGSPEDEGFALTADHAVSLLPLPPDYCRSILLHHSFGGADLTSDDEFIEAEKVALEIVNKLGNLPLAAKMVGSFLRDKDLDVWTQTLRDDLLNTRRNENSHIPSFLIMCYLDLPVAHRRCFKFLSVFPKGYRFQQKQVVLLWMALGFLQQSRQNGKSVEELGDEYFNYLTLRSFFQRLGDGVSFIIHDMVHDLASYMFRESRDFLYHGSIEDFADKVSNPLLLRGIWLRERARRLLPPQEVQKELSKLNPNIFRVVSLSSSINELPPLVGELTCLRYLDLSYTTLQVLPDSIGKLYYLQTLLLTKCTSLTSLPERLSDLANLRHLDIRGTGVQEMPAQMNRLTSLQTLTDFVISRSSQGFRDLAQLSHIRTLAISNLHNVVDATDASSAKLKKKRSLNDLTLRWGSGQDHREIGSEVLENLVPHENIKHLTIEHYGGVKFTGWLRGELFRFRTLQSVKLHHCNCSSLPPLAQLQGLKDLVIEGFHKITHIGPEFWGGTGESKAFRALESLQFRDMSEWKEWKILEDVEFQNLRELSIICCPKLVEELPKELGSLEKLEISGCYDLVASLPTMKPTCEVYVQDSNETLMKRAVGIPNSSRHLIVPVDGKQFAPTGESHDETEDVIGEPDATTDNSHIAKRSSFELLTVSNISQLEEKLPPIVPVDGKQFAPYSSSSLTRESHDETEDVIGEPDATTDNSHIATSSSEDERSSFEMLTVSNISQLEEKLPPKLDSLRLEDCAYLESLPKSLQPLMQTLQELYLIDCYSLKSFPPRGFPISVTTLYVSNCPKLELFATSESTQMFESLEHLCIGNSCDSLEDFTLNLFLKLRTLCIWDCSSLASLTISEEFQGDLPCLESLEIRDCPNLKSFPTGRFPTPNMASLLVSNCKILNNIPNPKNSLRSLQSLIVRDCPALESYSLDALPSSLTSLSIAFCDKLTPQKSWGMHNLQYLSSVEIEGGCIDMKSFPEEKLLPSNINTLRISTLHSLEKLDYKGFEHLNALQALEIDGCKQLQSLPEEGLPSSLLYLCIKQSPLLTQKLTSKAGNEWSKVAHIPQIEIDGEVIC